MEKRQGRSKESCFNGRTRGKEKGGTLGKEKEGTLNDYEIVRNNRIAENNEVLESFKLPALAADVYAQQRPTKIAKVTECTNGIPCGNHNLRSRLRNNLEQNEDGHADNDLEYQPEEHGINTNEEIEELEPDEQPKKNGRGITRKLNIYSREGQPKIKIALNEYGQPVGHDSKEFANFVGTMVRKKISLACDDWREVDIKKKFEVWTAVQSYYEIDEAGMSYVMATAAKQWRDFKADLKKTCFDATLTHEELIERRDKRVNELDWEWLINHWKSPEAEARAIRGKANREKLRTLHTAGTKSHARVRHELGEKLGHAARRDEVWIMTHTRKNGEPIPQAESTIEKLKEAAENYPDLKEKTVQEGDLFSYVCGEKEPRGRVRVLGKGPTPQDVGTPGACNKMSTRNQLQIEAHQQTQQKFNALIERMDQMQQRFDFMERMIQSQGVQIVQTSQNASNSRHTSEEHHSNENESIIRKKVVTPRMPSRNNAAASRSHEASNSEENIVGRDVILYAVLRADTPVAKATIVSTDPSDTVGGQALGVEYFEVIVNVVLKKDALLPRPYDDMKTMADAHYMPIAWPHNKLKCCNKRPQSQRAGPQPNSQHVAL